MMNGRQKLGKTIMKFVAAALTVTLISPASLGNVAEAAAKAPVLSLTKTTDVVIGEKLTLSVKNKVSGSKYTWKSSHTKIAKVSTKGVVTAVKKGRSNITCKVVAPKKTYNLKVKVNVVDRVVVATQAQLTKALKNTKLSRITIKTSKAVNFNIPAGTHTKTLLLVNAPKSDVTNNARFKSIVIDQIKANTFTEKGKGNSFNLRAPKTNLIIAKGANVKDILLRGKESNITVNGDVSGKIEFIKGASAAKNPILNLAGDTESVIDVIINNPGAALETEVKVDVAVNAADAELTFAKGSEGSNVVAASNDVKPEVKKEAGVTVTESVKETPSTGGGTGDGGGGGDVSNTTTETITGTVNENTAIYELPREINELTNLRVNVNTGLVTANYTFDSTTLGQLFGLLNKEAQFINSWKTKEIEDRQFGSLKAEFSGIGNEKIITFKSGSTTVGTFEAELVNNDSAIQIKKSGSNVTYTLSKVSSKTLKIVSSVPMDTIKVSFTVTYNN